MKIEGINFCIGAADANKSAVEFDRVRRKVTVTENLGCKGR